MPLTSKCFPSSNQISSGPQFRSTQSHVAGTLSAHGTKLRASSNSVKNFNWWGWTFDQDLLTSGFITACCAERYINTQLPQLVFRFLLVAIGNTGMQKSSQSSTGKLHRRIQSSKARIFICVLETCLHFTNLKHLSPLSGEHTIIF